MPARAETQSKGKASETAASRALNWMAPEFAAARLDYAAAQFF
jgi:hypothetical protein